MKHHIYITPEGVIRWIKEMPEKIYESENVPWIYNARKYEYEQAIERAKAESLAFEEADADYVYNLIIQQHKVSLHPHGLNVAPKLKEGIYPIELDEDIQEAYVGIGPGIKGLKKVAKIIPKKAEESEDVEIREFVIKILSENWDKIMLMPTSFTFDMLKLFKDNGLEIKRKPL